MESLFRRFFPCLQSNLFFVLCDAFFFFLCCFSGPFSSFTSLLSLLCRRNNFREVFLSLSFSSYEFSYPSSSRCFSSIPREQASSSLSSVDLLLRLFVYPSS
ncbi:hypothetical protein CSUI_003900 [Cystoisospora suis]|uniref:Transmembrane protein n=1 Tax=Cystoisospora suis TaxID=483139 RepID=A0A2C6L357_9APIC|nr:hypothetical protein CSUI_003900 [Cystoisospora suis]